MRKRSVLLVSAFGATLSFQALAQPAPEATKPAPPANPAATPGKPAEAKPAEAKPAEPAADGKPAAKPAEAPPAPAPDATGEEPAPAAQGPDAPPAAAQPDSFQQQQPGLSPLPIWPEPTGDGAANKAQPSAPSGAKVVPGNAVFAEDWWTHTRPILEWHGAFRARGELFYKFHLGRVDEPDRAIFPRPIDHYYTAINAQGTGNGSTRGAALCTPEELGVGSASGFNDAKYGCDDNTNAGANIRFRLDPEFHVSDNLRVIAQIDLLDNLVLGSTPNGYSSVNGSVQKRSGYAPLGAFDDDASAPSGRNSLKDSIIVKRVWAEWVTPVGQLKVGRMPNHWGLGMVWNSGDGPDDDYQSTIDRAQITTGFKSLDLYFSASMDFPNEGPTSDALSIERGQPYDVAQLDDVNQYTFSIAHVKSPELLEMSLNRGDLVLNGGAQVQYRHQQLATDIPGNCDAGAAPLSCDINAKTQFVRRGANMWLPDVWVRLLYRDFRFEAEAATVQGSIDNVSTTIGVDETGYKVKSWGFATEFEQKLVEKKLSLGFKFGWASGDADVDSLQPGSDGIAQSQNGDHTISTFRFHPSYGLDLILYRNLLTRVQGAYYFRPSVKYDFLRDPNGQKIGGGIAALWSRAGQFVQTPGHDRDLGVEINGQIYFQSKDGSLNDDPDHSGGFFAKLEYGVLFPMAGLGYTPGEKNTLQRGGNSNAGDTNLAQILRLFLGVSF